jgi:hypothetical protein
MEVFMNGKFFVTYDIGDGYLLTTEFLLEYEKSVYACLKEVGFRIVAVNK